MRAEKENKADISPLLSLHATAAMLAAAIQHPSCPTLI